MSARTTDYKFEAVLGSGSFGKVHLVRKRKDRKTFVIKEQDVSQKAKTSYEMALGEIHCLRKMRHPNIIAYHDAWIEGSRIYIRMEYASRGTLKDLLERRQNPLKNEDALYLFSQVTLGVHHIHSQKILHRDLKPENIMLTGHLGDIVKIGDFGVSSSMQGTLRSATLAGSYYFMAPEMLRGQPCDFKCDIWSMGAILYQMVTNELPFQAKNLKDLVEAVCSSRIRPIEANTSPEVVNLVSKMLRSNPAYRPKIEQLLLCPYLVPYMIRVHLNIGRIAVSNKFQHHGASQNLNEINPFTKYLQKFQKI
ncbi:serine/threonine-protein kinase Nek8-like [Neodiprion virginianus]|uniref:serine/threonine-protein kinase Nek8-like n=1 Tax=Neodiprion fabricii TaxID=2872261 RepID=UPI001ED9275A|nr:serine/threonine-protein kinase Nek8-like [Neodiprion fabricii]XP_046618414.1 serine/threonine-protein kinase Nek8-like [Neodiprion virginianus]